MKQVFKKDLRLDKILPCLLIAMVLIMTIFATNVKASYEYDASTDTFSYTIPNINNEIVNDITNTYMSKLKEKGYDSEKYNNMSYYITVSPYSTSQVTTLTIIYADCDVICDNKGFKSTNNDYFYMIRLSNDGTNTEWNRDSNASDIVYYISSEYNYCCYGYLSYKSSPYIILYKNNVPLDESVYIDNTGVSSIKTFEGKTLYVGNQYNTETERGTGDNTTPDSGESGNGNTIQGNTNTNTDSDSSGSGSSSSEESNFSIIESLKKLVDFFNPLSENFILYKLLDLLNPFSENFFLLKLWDFLVDIIKAIGSIAGAIGEVIANIFSPLWNFTSSLLSWFNPFSENFFAYKLINLLSDLLEFLFVPSEERINAIPNTVKAKFDFIESIKIAINSLKDILNNIGNAPKLSLNLKASKYTEAQNIVVLDLSWYAPFKPYGDLIITGFVYLMFLWRLLVSLPSIINGAGGLVSTGTYLAGESENALNKFLDD